MFTNKRIYLIFCISLNFVNENSGTERSWNNDLTKISAQYGNSGPNFDTNLPHFTPFNDNEFLQANNNFQIDKRYGESLPDVTKKPIDSDKSDIDFLGNGALNIADPIDYQFQQRIKPIQNFVMGLYKNYRSAHEGNKTIGQSVMPQETIEPPTLISDEQTLNKTEDKQYKKTNKRKRENEGSEIKYNVGPGVNVSVDKEKELVNVYLDENCLKDIFTGRGKKYDLMSKILPLFILPFLIQSAVIPFIVSVLKLLLIKSIVVGKIAIFLLIVSAFRNHSGGQPAGKYEAAPAYYVDPPSRRSESSTGYIVEGKPSTWIN